MLFIKMNARVRLNEYCVPRKLPLPKPVYFAQSPQGPFTCELAVPGIAGVTVTGQGAKKIDAHEAAAAEAVRRLFEQEGTEAHATTEVSRRASDLSSPLPAGPSTVLNSNTEPPAEASGAATANGAGGSRPGQASSIAVELLQEMRPKDPAPRAFIADAMEHNHGWIPLSAILAHSKPFRKFVRSHMGKTLLGRSDSKQGTSHEMVSLVAQQLLRELREEEEERARAHEEPPAPPVSLPLPEQQQGSGHEQQQQVQGDRQGRGQGQGQQGSSQQGQRQGEQQVHGQVQGQVEQQGSHHHGGSQCSKDQSYSHYTFHPLSPASLLVSHDGLMVRPGPPFRRPALHHQVEATFALAAGSSKGDETSSVGTLGTDSMISDLPDHMGSATDRIGVPHLQQTPSGTPTAAHASGVAASNPLLPQPPPAPETITAVLVPADPCKAVQEVQLVPGGPLLAQIADALYECAVGSGEGWVRAVLPHPMQPASNTTSPPAPATTPLTAQLSAPVPATSAGPAAAGLPPPEDRQPPAAALPAHLSPPHHFGRLIPWGPAGVKWWGQPVVPLVPVPAGLGGTEHYNGSGVQDSSASSSKLRPPVSLEPPHLYTLAPGQLVSPAAADSGSHPPPCMTTSLAPLQATGSNQQLPFMSPRNSPTLSAPAEHGRPTTQQHQQPQQQPLNAIASLIAGTPVYGNALITACRASQKLTDDRLPCMRWAPFTASDLARLAAASLPHHAYTVSRFAPYLIALPRHYTSQSAWVGKDPKTLLNEACMRHLPWLAAKASSTATQPPPVGASANRGAQGLQQEHRQLPGAGGAGAVGKGGSGLVPAFSRVLLEEGGAGGQTDAGKSENSDIESEGDIEGEGEGHPLTHTVGYVQLTLPIPPPLTLLGSLLAPNSIPAGAAASQYGRAETGTSGSAVHSQEPDGTGLGDSETQQQKRQRTEPGPASCSWVVKEPVGSWEAWEVEAAEQRAALQAVHQLQDALVSLLRSRLPLSSSSAAGQAHTAASSTQMAGTAGVSGTHDNTAAMTAVPEVTVHELGNTSKWQPGPGHTVKVQARLVLPPPVSPASQAVSPLSTQGVLQSKPPAAQQPQGQPVKAGLEGMDVAQQLRQLQHGQQECQALYQNLVNEEHPAQKPLSFETGVQAVVPELEAAVMQLGVGGKATVRLSVPIGGPLPPGLDPPQAPALLQVTLLEATKVRSHSSSAPPTVFSPSLGTQRMSLVLQIMHAHGVRSMVDLGCGEARACSLLLSQHVPSVGLTGEAEAVLGQPPSSGSVPSNPSASPLSLQTPATAAGMPASQQPPVTAETLGASNPQAGASFTGSSSRPGLLDQYVGIDISTRGLTAAIKRLSQSYLKEEPGSGTAGDSSGQAAIGEVVLLHGNSLTPDYTRPEAWGSLHGADMVLMAEVIEHLDPTPLAMVGPCVLGGLQPRLLVVTTPNWEANGIIRAAELAQRATAALAAAGPSSTSAVTIPAAPQWPGPPGRDGLPLRCNDHRFEWTRAEFKAWAQQLAEEHGYDVTFTGIGYVSFTSNLPELLGCSSDDQGVPAAQAPMGTSLEGRSAEAAHTSSVPPHQDMGRVPTRLLARQAGREALRVLREAGSVGAATQVAVFQQRSRSHAAPTARHSKADAIPASNSCQGVGSALVQGLPGQLQCVFHHQPAAHTC